MLGSKAARFIMIGDDIINIRIEERSGGIYFKYVFEVLSYDVHTAALRTMRWYTQYLNKKIDINRYSYYLTHKECIFSARINQSEMDQSYKESIILKAEKEIACSKKNLELLSVGIVPDEIKKIVSEEFEDISCEW